MAGDGTQSPQPVVKGFGLQPIQLTERPSQRPSLQNMPMSFLLCLMLTVCVRATSRPCARVGFRPCTGCDASNPGPVVTFRSFLLKDKIPGATREATALVGYMPITSMVIAPKNRAVCIEVLGLVSSLGQRQVLIAGDWNFEPSEMPIDLIHGGQIVRLLSDEAAAAPQGQQVKLDWFLTSKMLAPACGLEEATDLKPDHVAVRLPLKLERLSPGFWGRKLRRAADH
eukprot:2812505-Amphidinium_carterae.2